MSDIGFILIFATVIPCLAVGWICYFIGVAVGYRRKNIDTWRHP